MSPPKATPTDQDEQRARVRNNQRNARARRQDYMKELERKWSDCVRLGARANAEMQLAARRVAVENEFLRDLLRQRGLDEDALGTQIQQFWQSRSAGRPTVDTEVLLASKPCLSPADHLPQVSESTQALVVTSGNPIQDNDLPPSAISNEERVAAKLPCVGPANGAPPPSLGFDHWLDDLYNLNGSFNEDFEDAFNTYVAADMVLRDQQMPPET